MKSVRGAGSFRAVRAVISDVVVIRWRPGTPSILSTWQYYLLWTCNPCQGKAGLRLSMQKVRTRGTSAVCVCGKNANYLSTLYISAAHTINFVYDVTIGIQINKRYISLHVQSTGPFRHDPRNLNLTCDTCTALLGRMGPPA